MSGFKGKPVTEKSVQGSKKSDSDAATVPKEARGETHKAPNSK